MDLDQPPVPFPFPRSRLNTLDRRPGVQVIGTRGFPIIVPSLTQRVQGPTGMAVHTPRTSSLFEQPLLVSETNGETSEIGGGLSLPSPPSSLEGGVPFIVGNETEIWEDDNEGSAIPRDLDSLEPAELREIIMLLRKQKKLAEKGRERAERELEMNRERERLARESLLERASLRLRESAKHADRLTNERDHALSRLKQLEGAMEGVKGQLAKTMVQRDTQTIHLARAMEKLKEMERKVEGVGRENGELRRRLKRLEMGGEDLEPGVVRVERDTRIGRPRDGRTDEAEEAQAASSLITTFASSSGGNPVRSLSASTARSGSLTDVDEWDLDKADQELRQVRQKVARTTESLKRLALKINPSAMPVASAAPQAPTPRTLNRFFSMPNLKEAKQLGTSTSSSTAISKEPEVGLEELVRIIEEGIAAGGKQVRQLVDATNAQQVPTTPVLEGSGKRASSSSGQGGPGMTMTTVSAPPTPTPSPAVSTTSDERIAVGVTVNVNSAIHYPTMDKAAGQKAGGGAAGSAVKAASVTSVTGLATPPLSVPGTPVLSGPGPAVPPPVSSAPVTEDASRALPPMGAASTGTSSAASPTTTLPTTLPTTPTPTPSSTAQSLSALVEELDKLKTANSGLKWDRDRVAVELAGMAAELEDARKKALDAMRRAKQASSSVTTVPANVPIIAIDAAAKVNDLQAQLASATKERDAALAQLDQVTAALSSAQAQTAALQHQLESTSADSAAEITRLRSELDHAQTALVAAREEEHKLVEALMAAHAETERLAAVASAAAGATAASVGTNPELSTLKADLERTQAALVVSRDEEQKLAEALLAAHAEVDVLKKQVEELSAVVNSSSPKRPTASTEEQEPPAISALRRESLALHTEVTHLQHELDMERDDHVRTVKSLMSSIQSLENQLGEKRKGSMSVEIAAAAVAVAGNKEITGSPALDTTSSEPTSSSAIPHPQTSTVIDRLRRESISLHTELSHLHQDAEQEREDHLRAVAALSSTIKVLEGKNDGLVKEVEALRRASFVGGGNGEKQPVVEVERLRRQSVTLFSEVAHLQEEAEQEREDHLRTVAALSATIKQLEAKNVELARGLEERRMSIPSAPAELVEEQSEVDRLRRQSISLHHEMAHLHEEAEQEREDHLRTVAALSATIRELEEKNNAAAGVANSIASIEQHPEVDRLRRQSITLHHEMAHLHEEAEQEREDHLRTVAALSATIKSLQQSQSQTDNDRRGSVMSILDSEHPEVDRLRRQSVNLHSEMAHLEEAMEQEREDHLRTVDALTSTIKALESKAAGLEKRLMELGAPLVVAAEQVDAPVDRLRRQSVSLQSEVAMLHQELEHEREDHLRAVSGLTGTIRALEEKVRLLDGKLMDAAVGDAPNGGAAAKQEVEPIVDRLRRQSVSLQSEVSALQKQMEHESEDHVRAIASLSGTIKLLEDRLKEEQQKVRDAAVVGGVVGVAVAGAGADRGMEVKIPERVAAGGAASPVAVSAAAAAAAVASEGEPVVERLRRESITLHSQLATLHGDIEEEREDHIRTINSLTGSITQLEAKLKEQAELMKSNEARVAEVNSGALKKDKLLRDLRNAVVPAGAGIASWTATIKSIESRITPFATGAIRGLSVAPGFQVPNSLQPQQPAEPSLRNAISVADFRAGSIAVSATTEPTDLEAIKRLQKAVNEMNSALASLDKLSLKVPDGHALALDKINKMAQQAASVVQQQPMKKGWFR